ncbi:MAG: hypothetical protein RL357_111 [Pseudomonadota bacterium]
MHNSAMKNRYTRMMLVVIAAAVLAACSSTKVRGPAPVVARDVNLGNKPTPSGYHRVQAGESLVAISRLYSVDWKDMARWNNLSDPNRLEVGQLLALSGASEPAKPVQRAESNGVVVRPISNGTATAAQPQESAPAPVEKVAESAAPASALKLIWPADGPVVAQFDGNNNKGIGIGGQLGAPVLAAADGRVVYAGSGLRGYGNLVIIKHDDTFLTAYAHNQALLVKEDQAIKQGQRIAEMGNSESDVVKLHFEVRQLGKPVNPMTYLPNK